MRVLYTIILTSAFLLPFHRLCADTNTIQIGSIFILSGEGMSWGENARRGTELARKEINQAGGVNGKQLEIIYEDSPGGKAEKAVSAYKKLTAIDNIHYILGPIAQDELDAIGPLLSKDKVFAVSTTTSNELPENVLSIWMDPPTAAKRLAKFIRKRHSRVAVLSSQQSWETTIASSFRKSFEQLGGTVVSYEEPSQDISDVKVQVLKTKAANPEAVFVSSYFLFSNYMKRLKELKINVPIYGIELDQSTIDSTGGAAEGVVFISPVSPTSEFLDKFRTAFNREPDIPAAQYYDGTHLLAKALKMGFTSADELRKHFSGFSGYSGASGNLSVTEGRTVMDTQYFVVRDGKITEFIG